MSLLEAHSGMLVRHTRTEQATLWGLTPTEICDRSWAARGIQVVRRGQRSQILDRAELFLLVESDLLTAFVPARIVERLYWADAELVIVRLHDEKNAPYVERVLSDDFGNFLGFQRAYPRPDTRLARVILTPDRAVADAWQTARDLRSAWQMVRSMVPRNRRLIDRVRTRVYDAHRASERADFVKHLARTWSRPDATIDRCNRHNLAVWADPTTTIERRCLIVGTAWIGAGRRIPDGATVVGPAVLWDLPDSRPPVTGVRWQDLEPTQSAYDRAVHRARGLSFIRRKTKRAFDLAFAAAAILVTLPLYPLVMLAILFEDGRPFFFGHPRETAGGREFLCWKFRSMRKDADAVKRALMEKNQVDGPQFYMKNDPRLTRVGRLIRRLNIDELPQFWNVLKGDMSVVGPRPSPNRENQFCPSWREARLSVRPGITGLWQIMRTRRPGMDFQEWIKYDLEYVERFGLRNDLSIICQTMSLLFRGKL